MGEFRETVLKNLSESANKGEIEALFDRYDTEDIVDSKTALDFILKNRALRSGLDSYVTRAVTEHDKRFVSDKLPKILEEERDKIKAKLNPAKTEAEKELAAIKDDMAKMKAKGVRLELEKHLRRKAKELEYPEDRAERFAVYGDEAEQRLEEEAEFFKTHISTRLESEIKTRFKGVEPPKKSDGDNTKVMDRADFDKLTPAEQGNFIRNGGKPI